MAEIKHDPEWDFEEKDDVRTWKKEELNKFSEIDDYWTAWRRLLMACGKVNYYRKFYDNLNSGDTLKVEQIAEQYGHDIHYYEQQYREWWIMAQKDFFKLRDAAVKIGVYDENYDKREFLISLLEYPRKIEKIHQIIKTRSAKHELMAIGSVLKLAQARASKPPKPRKRRSEKSSN